MGESHRLCCSHHNRLRNSRYFRFFCLTVGPGATGLFAASAAPGTGDQHLADNAFRPNLFEFVGIELVVFPKVCLRLIRYLAIAEFDQVSNPPQSPT